MEKIALVTGITGQDGYYLASLLLEKEYKVYGMQRRTASNTVQRVLDLQKKYPNSFFLRYGDLTDSASLCKLIGDLQPNEIYNLGAQSHVQVSFENPIYTADVDGLGTLRLLEAIRATQNKGIKFYQASTSELFGRALTAPQNESTGFHPRSPYGVSKLMAYWAVVNYREAFNLFACNGILFNHESPIRGEMFVTRKITRAIADIIKGKQEKLFLGNLDAKRDWGFAGDYTEAMWLILQQENPDDYVIATGETRTVREFVEIAFREVGITLQWEGEGVSEVGKDEKGKVVVAVDPAFYRPAEVDLLLGDATKAKEKLGWQPKTSFSSLVQMMVAADLKV